MIYIYRGEERTTKTQRAQRIFLCVLCVFVVLFSPLLRVLAGQTTTGTLVGTVVDQSSSPVEGAEVTVTNRATGFRFGKQRTDTSGIYRVDFVPPGEYDIT